jgi:hypothetical protein
VSEVAGKERAKVNEVVVNEKEVGEVEETC